MITQPGSTSTAKRNSAVAASCNAPPCGATGEGQPSEAAAAGRSPNALSPALRSNRGKGSRAKQLPLGIAQSLKPRLAEQQGQGQPGEAAAPGHSPSP
ncbi:hypothetical protein ACFTRD_30700 [Paenibacillus sp. NPDC056933]|uniref:hypothetical protein n=1 Tax=Paenibacillus sp. NPDC056933 TaxID=3345968 RepID=UPI00363E7ACB